MKALYLVPCTLLAIACTTKKDSGALSANLSTSPPTAAVVAPDGAQTVFGVVEVSEKCPGEEGPCLKVVGGDDFNDKQTFWIAENGQEFEIQKDLTEGKRQKFRIGSPGEGVMAENHASVQLLGKIEESPNGEKRLVQIQSVTLLDK